MWTCPKCGYEDSISHEGERRVPLLDVPRCPQCYGKFVQGMLKDLREVEDDLSEWERDFVKSLEYQWGYKQSLSDKQLLKLNSIWEVRYAKR
jgi:hypothetical protein